MGIKVTRVKLVLQDPRESKEIKVIPAHRGHREFRGLKEPPENKAYRGSRARKEIKAMWVNRGLKVIAVLLVLQGVMAFRLRSQKIAEMMIKHINLILRRRIKHLLRRT